MGRVFVAGSIEGALLVMGVYLVPPDWLGPVLIGGTSALALCAAWSYRHGLNRARWAVLTKQGRVYWRLSRLKKEQVRREKVKAEGKRLAEARFFSNPVFGSVGLDNDGNISASVQRPRIRLSMKGWAMKAVVWTCNRPWLVNRPIRERLMLRMVSLVDRIEGPYWKDE